MRSDQYKVTIGSDSFGICGVCSWATVLASQCWQRLYLSGRLQEPLCQLDYSRGTYIEYSLDNRDVVETHGVPEEVHAPMSAKAGDGGEGEG